MQQCARPNGGEASALTSVNQGVFDESIELAVTCTGKRHVALHQVLVHQRSQNDKLLQKLQYHHKTLTQEVWSAEKNSVRLRVDFGQPDTEALAAVEMV